MKHDIRVGQTVWIRHSTLKFHKDLTETTVNSVGKKYFTVSAMGYQRAKFNLENLFQESDSSYRARIYLNPQEYYDEMETQVLSHSIRQFFSGYGNLNLSLPQMRQINEIINPTQP